MTWEDAPENRSQILEFDAEIRNQFIFGGNSWIIRYCQ